jgi:CRISPR-associated protein Csm4
MAGKGGLLKTYIITMKPLSGFATPLKGDTLFGQLCWQAVYDPGLFGASIDDLLSDYLTDPFVVVSSAYLKKRSDGENEYALKRPDLPAEKFMELKRENKKEFLRQRKLLKSAKWILVGAGKRMESLRDLGLLGSPELFDGLAGPPAGSAMEKATRRRTKAVVADFAQPHNTINRLTNTTGEGGFAPYSVEQHAYFPGAELAIFVGAHKKIDIEQIAAGFRRMGELGFGKDASTGLGRFEVGGIQEIDLAALGSKNPDACYTLGPCVPPAHAFSSMYFTPFTRFGRHGDVLAKSSNPFKNPVIMADEGAVFVAATGAAFDKPYIGSAVRGVSKAIPGAVTQGYSLYIPVRMED